MSTDITSTIHVDIDMDAPLPERYLGSDEDGPQYGPMSLYDAIIAAAANQITNRALTQDGLKEGYSTLVEHVRRVRDEMIREAIAPLIEEALSKPLHKTNTYGEPTGQQTTLRELIDAEVKAQLANPSDRYDRKTTVLQKVVAEGVDRALQAELKATLDAGKSEVLKAVRAEGVKVIDEALRRAVSF